MRGHPTPLSVRAQGPSAVWCPAFAGHDNVECGLAMTEPRRFPAPWRVIELTESFRVVDANDQTLDRECDALASSAE